jgi:streptogramin lyase
LPDGIFVLADGTRLFSSGNTILHLSPSGRLTSFAGNPEKEGALKDGRGIFARFNGPEGLTVDRDGNVVVAVSTLAGGRQEDDDENDDENDVEVFADGQGQNARVKFPTSVVVAANGDIFVSDFYLSAIRVVTPQGAVRTLCGNGQAGFADAQGADARFNFPCGLAAGGGKRGFADRTAHSVSRWTRRRTCWWQISVNTRLGA